MFQPWGEGKKRSVPSVNPMSSAWLPKIQDAGDRGRNEAQVNREWTEVEKTGTKETRGTLTGREESTAARSPGAVCVGITNPLKESQSAPFT